MALFFSSAPLCLLVKEGNICNPCPGGGIGLGDRIYSLYITNHYVCGMSP